MGPLNPSILPTACCRLHLAQMTQLQDLQILATAQEALENLVTWREFNEGKTSKLKT